MAYNNGFPINYPQYYPQYQQQMPTQNNAFPTQQNVGAMQNSIIWVQGEAGAKSYLVAPNTTVQLWDSEAQTIYLKSADASGMPSIKTLDYTIRDAVMPVSASLIEEDKFIHKDELDVIKGQIGALEREIDKLKSRRREGGERNHVKSDL